MTLRIILVIGAAIVCASCDPGAGTKAPISVTAAQTSARDYTTTITATGTGTVAIKRVTLNSRTGNPVCDFFFPADEKRTDVYISGKSTLSQGDSLSIDQAPGSCGDSVVSIHVETDQGNSDFSLNQ